MKRNLLLQRDYLIFDPSDSLARLEPVENTCVVPGPAYACFRKTAAFGLTLSVYGTIGTSDLTGENTVEGMEIWLGDGEITTGLPENFIQELVSACIEENP